MNCVSAHKSGLRLSRRAGDHVPIRSPPPATADLMLRRNAASGECMQTGPATGPGWGCTARRRTSGGFPAIPWSGAQRAFSGLREQNPPGNVGDRTYGARHARTTQPLRRHRDRWMRGRRPPRPGRIRGGRRPGGMEQVREHHQRAPGRQDHQRGHGSGARPVRGRGGFSWLRRCAGGGPAAGRRALIRSPH
jgi:hypothetical protein